MLDTIHGARVIAQKMAESGMEAEALEVYHQEPSVSEFDLVVAPVHLPGTNPVLAEARRLGKMVITHHRAVGELLTPLAIPDLQVIEVTGTHSKTSTSLLLARILSRQRRVLTHTTRGLEIWNCGESCLVRKGLSITPANVILATAEARDQGVSALISEVSLGGTGLADWGVLTSFSGDYRIAGQSRWASSAKLQMLSLAKEGARLAANTDTRISADVSFGANGGFQAGPDRLILGAETLPVSLSPDLDFPSYQTALAAAGAMARSLGVSKEEIARALLGFDGFSGRMKVLRQGDLTIYDSSNSGLKVSDVQRALDKIGGPRQGMVVGEESQTVCEGLDIPALIELLRARRSEMDHLILVGERLSPWRDDLEAGWARDFEAGLEQALTLCASLDRLLLCVKCFR